jgi:hypothetical protein
VTEAEVAASANTVPSVPTGETAYSSSLLYSGQEGMYAVPGADKGVGRRERVGALTWEHIGAARFAENPQPWDKAVWDDGTSNHNPFYGMHRVDAEGRLWKVVEVDNFLLEKGIAQYDLLALGDEIAFQQISGTTDTADTGEVDTGVEDAVEDTEGGWIEYESFTEVDCDASLSSVNHTWDQGGTENVIVNWEMSVYETDPVVAVTSVLGGCSGVLVRSDVVLTAAHCVVDATGAVAAPNSSFDVCTRGNWAGASPDCSYGYDIYVNPSVTDNSPSAKDDWALIRLWLPIGSTNSQMYFSTANSSTINSADLLLGGYPGMWRSDSSCTANWTTANSDDSSVMSGSREHLATGEAATVYTKSLRLNVTHGSGYSGGPYFYDPGSTGGRRYVVGVHSGNNPVTSKAMGARASYWRSQWISVINNDI